jgi:hypothetical protein
VASIALAGQRSRVGSIGICLSWCLRLPHHELPIPADFKEYRSAGMLETAWSTGCSDVTAGDVLGMLGDRRAQDALPIPVLIRSEPPQPESD